MQQDQDQDLRPAPGPDVAPRITRWTTQRWLAAGICTAVVLMSVLTILAVGTFQDGSNATNRLVNRVLPAQTAATQLEAALINQETGVRGYGLTGQSDFLQPYTLGQSQELQAFDTLRTLTAGDAQEQADLAAIQTRATAWQQTIAVPIADSPPGAPSPLATQRADEGKRLFDALRVTMNTEQTHLQQSVTTGRAELTGARGLRTAVFTAIAAIMLLLFLLVFEGLRRGVARPLTTLSASTRLVTNGEFTHPITPTGPADLRALATDVEAMRRRLVEELANTDQARADLHTQAAELRRSNQELEQFAYVASHDLQEPLRKVASFCQLLQQRYSGQIDDRADQYIDFAVDGAKRMQKIITDLLAFSRVGRLHHDTTPVDLEACLAQAIDDLQVAIGETGARIEHDPLPTITGNATQLTLLLQNLLSNAIKFRTPERTPLIRLTAQCIDHTWHFAVTDNGIGIAPEFAERIFLIFQRLHARDAYPGTGIGLAMCRKIVDFHGGTIELDPTYQEGACFTFTLPTTG